MKQSKFTCPLPDSLGETLKGFGGLLRCMTCGREKPLGDPGEKLSEGWPRCCGYTMRWITERQFASGEYQR